MHIDYHKKVASDIFCSAIKKVDPYSLVLNFKDEIRAAYEHASAGKLITIGAGKASVPMGKAVEDTLRDIIGEGLLITKYGHSHRQHPPEKLQVIEAGHPIPDENGFFGTADAVRLLRDADEHTLVLCLFSGGASALLVCPYNGITLEEKQYVSEMLLKAGADITELNTVRKHISRVKGGRLAELAAPARVFSLILSDVIGDRLDVIASGPTAADTTTFSDALRVLEKHGLLNKAPESVLHVIRDGIKGLIEETPKNDNPLFENIENIIIGSNTIALSEAKQAAREKGLDAEILSSEIRGEAREVGKWLANKAIGLRKAKSSSRSCCLISGGETTVTVKGNGLGGRNTELALAFAMEIDGMDGITLLSAGTDGTDGPSDAAGAIVDGETIGTAKSLGLDPRDYLENNDSYSFFRKAGGLFITGPTGTNVMDIQIVLLR